MDQQIWVFIGIVAILCVIGSILEIRFVLGRRNRRLSEEMDDENSN